MKTLSRLTIAVMFTLVACSGNTETSQDTRDAGKAQAVLLEENTPEAICEASVPAPDPDTREISETESVLEPGVDYRAIFCTAAGPVYIDLLEEYAPIAVNNLVFLAQNDYYNNTTFHRVIADFMAQGGDPSGTGAGGPDYSFEDEFVGFLHFDRPGWLAMANHGANTNSSQFFITTGLASHLDYVHTIFGEVLEGQENVENIDLRDPELATEPGAALETIVIITDPAKVITTYESLPNATQEEVAAAFASLDEILPPEILIIDEERSDTFSTEETLETISDDTRDAYEEYFGEHNHQYRATNTIQNAACDLQTIPFESITYSLDNYASTEDAASALEDPVLADLTMSNGFVENDASTSAMTVYTMEHNVCDQEMTSARTYWQRGHFVATIEVTLPDGAVPTLDQALTSVGASIYERSLSDILRPELR